MSRVCFIGLSPSTAGGYKHVASDGVVERYDELPSDSAWSAWGMWEDLSQDNDNTIRKEIAISEQHGHRDGLVYARFNHDRTHRLILTRPGLVKVNLFSHISTNPKGLLDAENAEGDPENLSQILSAAKASDVVVAAWGGPYSPKALQTYVAGRARVVVDALTKLNVELRALGVTKDGFPRHPLYMRNDSSLQLWST